MTILHIAPETYEYIHKYLFSAKTEQVAFLFLEQQKIGDSLTLTVKDFFCVPQSELVFESTYHAEVTPEVQAKVIKQAWDNKLHLGEVHTHPFVGEEAGFSYSDRLGFEEFVPHVWWRLQKGPYIALVFGHDSFDALVWVQDPHTPERIEAIHVGDKILHPTNLSDHE